MTNIEYLNNESSLLVTVDMVNGFIREGSLASSYLEELIQKVVKIHNNLDKSQKVFFKDTHEENSKEFNDFPPHCIKGSSECEIVEELIPYTKDAIIIEKGTTNGLFAKEFKELFLNKLDEIKNIVIVGCCSDICVMNLALSLKTYLIDLSSDIQVVIVADGVDTYDSPTHNASVYTLMSLYLLKANGIKVEYLEEKKDDIALYPLTKKQVDTLRTEIESALTCDVEDDVREDFEDAVNALSSENPNVIR